MQSRTNSKFATPVRFVVVSFENNIGIYAFICTGIESSCEEGSKIDNVCTFSTIANVRSFPGTPQRTSGTRTSR
jgi:hypothetical protein